MKEDKVLLIGPSFLYDLVDKKLLKEHFIKPYFSYPLDNKKSQGHDDTSVYYQELSMDSFSRIIQEIQPDAIVCYNDNFLIEVGRLRDKFGIKGLSERETRRFKIKSEMYKCLEGVINCPETLRVEKSLTTQVVSDFLGLGEYFLKPENLAGAEGTRHFKTAEDFDSWIKGRDMALNSSYILQKYYNLPLVHCELYLEQGKVRYIHARQYSYPNHLFLQGKIIASLPIQDRILQTKIEESAAKVASSLGYLNGVMHTEFFVKRDGELIFLETNIRQAGGAINLIHKKRSGLSMETAMIMLELGRTIYVLDNSKGYDICGYIPVKKGIVSKIDVPKTKGEFEFDIRVKIGQICSNPKSASNTAVSFVGYSNSLNDLLDDFYWLENYSIIKYQNVE